MTTQIKIRGTTQKLDRYEGKWVAFMGKQIVAYNETLRDLMKEVDAKGLRKKVSVFLVPRKDEGPYILFRSRRILSPLGEI